MTSALPTSWSAVISLLKEGLWNRDKTNVLRLSNKGLLPAFPYSVCRHEGPYTFHTFSVTLEVQLFTLLAMLIY